MLAHITGSVITKCNVHNYCTRTYNRQQPVLPRTRVSFYSNETFPNCACRSTLQIYCTFCPLLHKPPGLLSNDIPLSNFADVSFFKYAFQLHYVFLINVFFDLDFYIVLSINFYYTLNILIRMNVIEV